MTDLSVFRELHDLILGKGLALRGEHSYAQAAFFSTIFGEL